MKLSIGQGVSYKYAIAARSGRGGRLISLRVRKGRRLAAAMAVAGLPGLEIDSARVEGGVPLGGIRPAQA